MGFFSSIGKFFKKVWGGIKKVFSKVMEGVGKILGSKLGKALMMAVSVFSMGTALLAGAKGFMAGQGFIGKFLNGGKEFLNTLLGTKFETEGMMAGGAKSPGGVISEGGATGVGGDPVSAGDVLTGGDPTAATGVGGGIEVPGAAGAPEVLKTGQLSAPGGGQLPLGVPGAAKEPGWLSKAATAAKDFATSDLGQTLIGNAMAGYGRGKEIEAIQKHQSRVERMFENPDDPGVRALREHDYTVDTPRGLAAAPGRLARQEAYTTDRRAPTIPFRRPVGTYAGG